MVALALILAVLCLSVAGCSPEHQGAQVVRQASIEYTWLGEGGGFQHWGSLGDRIYAVSVKPEILSIWKWHGARVRQHVQFPVQAALGVTPLSGDCCLLYPVKRGENALLVTNCRTGQVISRWPIDEGWSHLDIRGSGNGRYVAIGLDEDPGYPPPGYQWDKPRVRLGLVSVGRGELVWVATLVGHRGGQESTVREVAPSDNGRYIGVAGWDNGLTMIDVVGKKVFWSFKPDDEAAIAYAAFTPDSKTVYAGGTMGWVYGIDVKNGKLVSQWCATRKGEPEYGHRISGIAVSPDGSLVAAGTGPEGEVYLWSRTSGKLLRVFMHGGMTVLITTFSPDSKALATFCAGRIKVWDIPEGAD